MSAALRGGTKKLNPPVRRASALAGKSVGFVISAHYSVPGQKQQLMDVAWAWALVAPASVAAVVSPDIRKPQSAKPQSRVR
jgi:hypothetical protein